MSRKLMFFFVVGLFMFSGCLYSCNYMPEGKGGFKSTDPCDASGGSQLVKFVDISGDSEGMNISMVMLLPCKGDGKNGDTYSLAFYDVNNFSEPSDLTHLKAKDWTFKSSSCADLSKNNTLIDNNIKNDPDFFSLTKGAAITFGVGLLHSNRLYPYYIKVPITNFMNNPDALGKPNIDNSGFSNKPGACVNNVNMSPFIQDEATLSPIYQKGRVVNTEDGEVDRTNGMFQHQLVGISAPFFTYGTLRRASGSEEGLKSSPGLTTEGSYFQFHVHINPGEYYVVLSKVVKPAQAAFGDFSLKDVKIFNDGTASKYKDYLTDCNKSVTCGTPITV